MEAPNSNPMFSVITITYNAASTIETTLKSVISQSYGGIEYIIIDGKSTDETMNIVQKYAAYITRIVSEPDNGLYDAMNKGLRYATGDYVCFLNAGDTFYEEDTLYKLVDSIESFQQLPDVIYGETALVDEQRNFVGMRRLKTPEKLSWKSFKKGMTVCHQAFIAKRELAEPYDLQYRFSSDVDWCIRIMKKSHFLYNSHLIIVDYLKNGLTLQNHKASLKERFRIMAKHYGLVTTIGMHLCFIFRTLKK